MDGWEGMMKEFLQVFKSISWKVWMKNIILMTFLFMLVLGGCSYLNSALGLEDDNPIEQSIEGVIQHKTGLRVDLTP